MKTYQKILTIIGAILILIFSIFLTYEYKAYKLKEGYTLLYLQGCTIGNIRNENSKLKTLKEEIRECRKRDKHAGYYLYNIKTKENQKITMFDKYVFNKEVAKFPTSIYGSFEQIAENFSVIDDKYPVFCKENGEVYSCDLLGEIHQLPFFNNLDLLIPKGWVVSEKI